jgi:hypothetical protein
VDADGDGYGNPTQVVRACMRPSGAVSEAGDCHDGKKGVHPGQAEQLCDGEDENCSGAADENFHLGSACETELGCAGTRGCTTDKSAAVCASTQSPMPWFVDEDGDGRYGTSVGLSCKTQPDARTLKDDCDEGSRFLGGAEVCDRLDNNCDGRVDEGGLCAGGPWSARSVLGGDTTWEAVTSYGLGRAWLAGAGGRLAHVDGATVTDIAGCTGNWKAAWARPSDGRVFLGSADGVLGSATTSGTACVTASVGGVTSSINGLVGFERSGVTTVYAVTSGGHVLRWEWRSASSPSAPVVAATVPANLRSIHGLGEGTLLAVGAESYQLDNSTAVPRAFRLDTASGSWKPESLPADVGTGFLRGVSVVDGRLAYAVGDRGLVLARENGAWRKLTSPDGTTDLVDVVAFDPTVVLVLSKKANTYLHRLNGTTWTEPFPQGQALLSLDGFDPREQWAVGQGGTLVHWGL